METGNRPALFVAGIVWPPGITKGPVLVPRMWLNGVIQSPALNCVSATTRMSANASKCGSRDARVPLQRDACFRTPGEGAFDVHVFRCRVFELRDHAGSTLGP